MKDEKTVGTQPEKKMRWSDQELSLMTATFHENDKLQGIFRMFLFQTPLTDEEWLELKSKATATPEAFALFKKVIHPELDPRNAPAFQLTDLWYAVETKDRDADSSFGFILARSMVVDYFDELFNYLRTIDANYKPDTFKIKFAEFTKNLFADNLNFTFAKIHARKVILDHVDAQLNQVRVLTLKTAKTEEQRKAEAKKNSTK